MTTYKHNCRKCTNKLTDGFGNYWCRPVVEGKRGTYIESGDSGKNFVLNCDHYTTEPMTMGMYLWECPGRKLTDEQK